MTTFVLILSILVLFSLTDIYIWNNETKRNETQKFNCSFQITLIYFQFHSIITPTIRIFKMRIFIFFAIFGVVI